MQQSYDQLVETNVASAIKKMDHQLKRWSRRQLSTLGKILICKTFAISQLIYIMQTLVLNETHFKRANQILYKFIWNRHYHHAKAPERINRSITNSRIKTGGLGMLDVAALDKSLKLKSVGRLMCTRHPMLIKIRNFIDYNQFFFPNVRTTIDPFSNKAVEFLGTLRRDCWENQRLNNNVAYVRLLLDAKAITTVNAAGRLSLGFRLIWNAGKRKLGQLTEPELNLIGRFMHPGLVNQCRHIIRNNYARIADPTALGNLNTIDTVFVKGKAMRLSDLSSKKIREELSTNDVITEFKIGLNLEENLARTWLLNVSKLTNTLHKNHLLLAVHKALYSKERCFRYGLIDDPDCPRCDMVETLAHKIYECEYSKKIWNEVIKLTTKLENNVATEVDRLKQIFAAVQGTDPTIISIHAETLLTIVRLKQDAEFLVHPRILAENIVKKLIKLENSLNVKEKLTNILLTD